uniref:Putative secreted protein n=1 Tax=Ixodes ricinus TaxID=34613 RepID=A0A147BRS5_IXORI
MMRVGTRVAVVTPPVLPLGASVTVATVPPCCCCWEDFCSMACSCICVAGLTVVAPPTVPPDVTAPDTRKFWLTGSTCLMICWTVMAVAEGRALPLAPPEEPCCTICTVPSWAASPGEEPLLCSWACESPGTFCVCRVTLRCCCCSRCC